MICEFAGKYWNHNRVQPEVETYFSKFNTYV
jgi:hypothetical protein